LGAGDHHAQRSPQVVEHLGILGAGERPRLEALLSVNQDRQDRPVEDAGCRAVYRARTVLEAQESRVESRRLALAFIVPLVFFPISEYSLKLVDVVRPIDSVRLIARSDLAQFGQSASVMVRSQFSSDLAHRTLQAANMAEKLARHQDIRPLWAQLSAPLVSDGLGREGLRDRDLGGEARGAAEASTKE
jgi:hypothetical protein